MENELYTFVAREFAFAYTKQFPNIPPGLKDWKSGSELPAQNFRYEKIYPKSVQGQKMKKNNKHT